MKRDITIHKSPIVLIFNIFVFQILFGIIIFLLINIDSKFNLIGKAEPGSQLEILPVIFLVVIEILMLILIFFQWFNEAYDLDDSQIIYRRGLFLRKKEVYKLDEEVNFVSEESMIGDIFKFINLEVNFINKLKNLKFKMISKKDAKKIIGSFEIKEGSIKKKNLSRVNIESILENKEDDQLEFKSTLRWDLVEKKVNKEMEHSVIKNIAGFLNADGGILVLGVSDEREILGLNEDYESLQKKNSDGFENHLNQLFAKYIGAEKRQCMSCKFKKIKGKEICIVVIKESDDPVFIKFNGQEHFFIRTGNSVSSLSVSETHKYCKSRFK